MEKTDFECWTSWEVEADHQPEWEALFRKVIEAALTEEKVFLPVEVELLVVNDDAICEMNREYRQIDRSTDVLSFPLCECEAGKAAQALLTEEPDPENGRVALGDIVLSWDHIAAQAEEYGHSLQREAAFLVAHSMLHLMGYDHMEPAEEEQMREKQRLIMDAIGLAR